MATVTYMGRRIGVNGKPVHGYERGSDEPSMYFDHPLSTGPIIGGRYDVPDSSDGKWKRNAQYVDRVDDADLLARWEAEDRATSVVIAAKRRERADDTDELRKALAPIKSLLDGKNRVDRAAIIAVVLDELYTRGA